MSVIGTPVDPESTLSPISQVQFTFHDLMMQIMVGT